jgi:hypothetical protein
MMKKRRFLQSSSVLTSSLLMDSAGTGADQGKPLCFLLADDTLILRRKRLKLRIHLPLGIEEGRYRGRLQRKTDGKAVFSQIARAEVTVSP